MEMIIDPTCHLGNGSYSPEQAAREFAATLCEESRTIRDFLPNGLCATFKVISGNTTYEVHWDDSTGSYGISPIA